MYFKRDAVVEWLERLGYGAGLVFEAGLRHATTGDALRQPSSKLVHFSNQGRIRQRKERDGLRPFIPTIPYSIPYCLQLLGYGKPLPLHL